MGYVSSNQDLISEESSKSICLADIQLKSKCDTQTHYKCMATENMLVTVSPTRSPAASVRTFIERSFTISQICANPSSIILMPSSVSDFLIRLKENKLTTVINARTEHCSRLLNKRNKDNKNKWTCINKPYKCSYN